MRGHRRVALLAGAMAATCILAGTLIAAGLPADNRSTLLPWAEAPIFSGIALALLSLSCLIVVAAITLALIRRVENSESTLRSIVDSATDPILSFDSQGSILQANPAAHRIFGYQPNQLSGGAIVDLFSENVSSLLAGRHGGPREVTAHHQDGTSVPLEVSVALTVVAGVPAYTAICRDISRRRRAEAALQGSERRFRQLFENMNASIVIYEAVENGDDFLIRDFNAAAEHAEGIGRNQVIGRKVTEAFPGIREFGLLEVFQRVWLTGRAEAFPLAFYADQRMTGWRDNFVFKLPSGEIVALYEDVTDRKKAEEEQRKLAALVENSQDFVGLAGLDGSLIYLNQAGRFMVGLDGAQDLANRRLADLLNPESGFNGCEVGNADPGAWRGETGLRHVENGEQLPVDLNLFVVRRPENSEPICLAIMARDITERRLAEAEQRMAHRVFMNTLEGIFVTDAQGTIISANPAAARITGYDVTELIGNNPRLFKSDHHDGAFYKELWASLLADGQWQGEIWNRRKDGALFLEWLTLSVIPGADGKPDRFVAVFNDITEIRQLDERIRHQAYHDALTGLPNRLLFNDRLEQAVKQARRHGGRLAVMFLDLDRFKNINDSLGHDVGDLLLKNVASRLLGCVRSSDTVARLGGDEFVIVLDDFGEGTDVAAVAEKILATLDSPMTLADHEVRVTTSIGIGLFPEDGDSATQLMKSADTAMYRAKEEGRNAYRFFLPEMNHFTIERLKLEAELRRAVDRGEFILYYQPKFDLASGRFTSMEALIRWHHPTRGLVAPGDFIPLAEETGLIVAIGDWVINEACRQNKAWQDEGMAPMRVAVNLSARQFHERDLVDRIAAILAETGLEPHWLEVELTESAIMRDLAETRAVLTRLKAMGITLSIDDFGTGYSSLNYLKDFPIDTLKIDRSFVADIGEREEGAAIVKAIINLARGMNLAAIAEGVETHAQANFLRDHQCGGIQGFLFSRPLPPDAFKAKVQELHDRALFVD